MITPEQKKKILIDVGVDPKSHWMDNDGNIIDMPEDNTPLTALKAAAFNAPSTALGVSGSALGLTAAGMLAPATGGASLAAGVTGATAGGAAGGALGKAIQETVYPESWQLAQEARAARSPGTVMAADVAASTLAMRPSPKVIGAALRAPRELLATAGQMQPQTREALLNIGVGAGLSGGMAAAQGAPIGDVALQTLIGAAQHQPTRLGTALSGGVFRPFTDMGAVRPGAMPTAEAMEAYRAALEAQNAPVAPEATIDPGVLAAMQKASKDQQRRQAKVVSDAQILAEAARMRAADAERAPEVIPPGGVVMEGPQGTKPFTTREPGQRAEPKLLDPRTIDERLAAAEEAELPRVDVAVEPEPAAPAPSDELRGASPLERRLKMLQSPELMDYLKSWADKFKATITGVKDMDKSGVFKPRKSTDVTSEILYNEKRGYVDVLPHEALHGMIDDALNYGTPREQAAMQRILNSLGLEVKQNESGRFELDATAEEALVARVGEGAFEAIKDPQAAVRGKESLMDFMDYYLRKLTPQSAERILRNRLVFGSGAPAGVRNARPVMPTLDERKESLEESAKIAEENMKKAPEATPEEAALPVAKAAPAPKPVDRAADFERARLVKEKQDAVDARRAAEEEARQARIERDAMRMEAENDRLEAARAAAEGANAPEASPGAPSAQRAPSSFATPTAPRRGSVGSARRGSQRAMRGVTPEDVMPGSEVTRPETRAYEGESIPQNIRRGRMEREVARETPEDLEMRRIEARLAGEERPRFQELQPERVFLSEFEKELSRENPFRFQVGKDGRINANDIRVAVKKLNESERGMLDEAGLSNFLMRTPRPTKDELSKWADENLPKVEVKELRAEGEVDKYEQEVSQLRHELDTRFPTFASKVDENRQWKQEYLELKDQYQEAVIRWDKAIIAETDAGDNDSATRAYTMVNPRELADMPGAVDLLVRIPTKKLGEYTNINHAPSFPADIRRKSYAIRGKIIVRVAPKLDASETHYKHSGDNLLAHVRAYEHTMPNGEKVLRVFEVQSDWAQKRRKIEGELRERTRQGTDGNWYYTEPGGHSMKFSSEEDMMNYIAENTPGFPANDPLLPQHQRLALKAAIEHARKRGINKLVVDDADTAMLTERHDIYLDSYLEPTKNNIDRMIASGESPRDIEKLKRGERINLGQGNQTIRKWREEGFDITQAIRQEGGMRQAYESSPMVRDADGEIIRLGFESNDDAQAYVRGFRQESAMKRGEISVSRGQLHEMMRDMAGEGTKVDLGEHKNAFGEERTQSQADMYGGEPGRQPRPDLIFKNPDGTPKTTSTGYLYDISAPQARREAGEPFSLTGRRYQELRTNRPDFKNWFGDSKVVDESGQPLRVYHGTRSAGFNEFNMDRTVEMGMHFGTSVQANDFVKPTDWTRKIDANLAVYPVYLSIQRPFNSPDLFDTNPFKFYNWLRRTQPEWTDDDRLRFDKAYSGRDAWPNGWKVIKDWLINNGYDGVKYDNDNEGNPGDPDNVAWIAFYPTQIKSAIANVGTYDPYGDDIRYQPLGPERGSFKGAKLPERETAFRGIFAGNIEALRRTGDPDKISFAGIADELYARIRNYTGKYENALITPLEDLSTESRNRIIETMYDEDMDRKSYATRLNAKEQIAHRAIRGALKRMRQEQIAANQLINGKPAGIDQFYFPNIIDSTILHDLANSPESARAKEAERQFVEFNKDLFVKRGVSPADAQAKAVEAFGKFIGSLKPMAIESGFDYGAVSLPASTKLPPTWIQGDAVESFRNYAKRFGRARAFYDVMGRDENAMRLLGRKNYFDAAGKEVPVTNPGSRLVRDPNVRNLMESALGVTHESQEGWTPAVGRLANTLLLSNVMSRLTDVSTTPFKALSYLPVTQLPGLVKNLGNMRQSMENAYNTGGVRRGGLMVVREVLGAGDAYINKLDKVTQFITRVTGSEALERGSRFLSQNIGEYIYDVNSALARAGDKRADEFLRRLAPQWDTLAREEVAQRIAQLFQGRYDATNLPNWIQNSPAAPFFSMMKWNIEQWNNFKRFAWEPAKQGDVMPLVKTILGGVIGGLAVGEMREKITGKKQRVATFEELKYGFDEGDKTQAGFEAMRKAAFLAQVTGTIGVVGELALQGLDIAARDKPQGFSWPAFNLAASVLARVQNAGNAAIDNPQDAGLILGTAVNDLAKEVFTQYRIAMSVPDRVLKGSRGETEQANRRRDLRMSEKLRGEEVRRSPYIEADYAGTRERRFDREADMNKALEIARTLDKNARASSKTAPEYLEKRRKFRAMRIAGIPSVDNDPMQYFRHLQYVRTTQGAEAADALAADYARLRMEQKFKSGLFR